jgi:hypothetical protein
MKHSFMSGFCRKGAYHASLLQVMAYHIYVEPEEESL